MLSTLQTNTDIVLEPSGSGKVSADADVRISSGNRLEIVSNSSSNSVNLVAPSGMSSDLTLTLPDNNGNAGDVLTVDASGNLSFSDLTIEVADQTADTSNYFPLLSTANSGTISDVTVSSSKLSFQPSSGTLTVTNFVESSSIALKENFSTLENAIEKILRLEPKIYDRKDGSSFNEPGLIAEEVSSVIPDIVSLDADNNPQGIKYTKLTVYLIDCIKYLNNEIIEMKRKQ